MDEQVQEIVESLAVLAVRLHVTGYGYDSGVLEDMVSRLEEEVRVAREAAAAAEEE